MTWWAVAIGVGGSLLGGAISANGAENAANTQSNAQMQAAQIGQQEFNTIQQQEAPFTQGGYGALSELNYLMGIPSFSGGTTYTGGLGPNDMLSPNGPSSTSGYTGLGGPASAYGVPPIPGMGGGGSER